MAPPATGTKGCFKGGLSCRVQTPRNANQHARQALVAKENVLAARLAAPEAVVRTVQDEVHFPAPAIRGVQEMRALPMTGYARDPPVKRLFSLPPAGDASHEEGATTPKPSVSPRDTLQTKECSSNQILPGMTSSTSAQVLFARPVKVVQSHDTEEEPRNAHGDDEKEKGQVLEEAGQGVDAEAQGSRETCEEQAEGSELTTLRDNVAEMEQRLCMVREQLGEDAALPFLGPLSVMQRGLVALQNWYPVEERQQSLQWQVQPFSESRLACS